MYTESNLDLRHESRVKTRRVLARTLIIPHIELIERGGRTTTWDGTEYRATFRSRDAYHSGWQDSHMGRIRSQIFRSMYISSYHYVTLKGARMLRRMKRGRWYYTPSPRRRRQSPRKMRGWRSIWVMAASPKMHPSHGKKLMW